LRGGIANGDRSPMKRLLIFFLCAVPVLGQSNTGELRLKVTDPAGLGVKSVVELASEANQFHQSFDTDEAGNITARRLPFGVYQLQVRQQGFAPFSDTVEVRSAIPTDHAIHLTVASVSNSITVTESETLIDPSRPAAVDQIGTELIQDRTTSLPGRSIQDLVDSQPGWLYEGNAVLHPRGSEYQTQFVVNGIPLTDNRSPSFGPEIEADDVESMTIYTAGFPAEYGRKMGGVVEVNTLKDAMAGFHGQVVLSGGSYDSAGSFAKVQEVTGKNVFGFSAEGDMTDHYLNPVVPENYTNTGTTGDFAASYERDLTPNDRLTLTVRHELSRYEIPNEQLQEMAGQVQNADNFETMGTITYSHVFSSNAVGDLRGMVRDNSNDLYSNQVSTPIIVFQHNWFREGYFNGSISIHRGRQEWKAGVESDATFLHEQFNDVITDPAQFDDGTPRTFGFAGARPDLEQSAYVQDLIRLGKWTVSAGLRWDHYQLLVNKESFSPRLSVSRYFKSADLVLHASYDRVFQTPSFENILLSSSTAVMALNSNFLRLPVQPSNGNYYEVGFAKGFLGHLRVDGSYFLRRVDNYADDDQLLNTTVSFPIAFAKASIYGVEGKIDIPKWGNLSGYVSYSYIVGAAYAPVTGGLFLGDDAAAAASLTGRFWDSQDQRNTVRTRFRYQVAPRFWMAAGTEYGSGLPFDFGGNYGQALMEYGQQVVDRVNFATGRVRPSLSVTASAGADVYKTEHYTLGLQVDGENLNNRLNLIDFGGLFSGNAIGPTRSVNARLKFGF
jgi:hypothetical protein